MRPRVAAEPFSGSLPSEGARKERRKQLSLGPPSLGSCRSVPQRSRWGGATWRRPPTPAPPPAEGHAPRRGRRGTGRGAPLAPAARTFLSVCLWGAREDGAGAAPDAGACRGALARGPRRLRSAPRHGRPVGAGRTRSRRRGGHGGGDAAGAGGEAVPVRGGRRGRASRARAERLRERLAGRGHPSRVPPRQRPPGPGGKSGRPGGSAARPSARGRAGSAAWGYGAGEQAGKRARGRWGGPSKDPCRGAPTPSALPVANPSRVWLCNRKRWEYFWYEE